MLWNFIIIKNFLQFTFLIKIISVQMQIGSYT